jgi:hypothetical protein
MKKLKGPDMKLPQVKIPKSATDLMSELRNRRLLPLVVVLMVAIVAVPIALSKSTSPPSSSGQSPTASISAANASHLTVVPDAPGLRDYHRRLKDRHAKDPFTPPETSSSQSSSTGAQSTDAEASTAESSSAEVPSASESTSANAENGSTTSGEAATVHLKTTYFSHAIDVRIVNSTSAAESTASKSEPIVRHNVPVQTKLPGKKTPAIVFMGASEDGKKAIMLISSNVRAVAGPNRCVFGTADVCQLLALKPGAPETFVYGANGRTFRIQLLKIHLVATHRPH